MQYGSEQLFCNENITDSIIDLEMLVDYFSIGQTIQLYIFSKVCF